MKYRKRPLFRIISTCVLALLAGLALAPGFGAGAKTGPLLAGNKNTVDGKSTANARPAASPKVTPHHRTAPQPDQNSSPAKLQDEQTPATQPQTNDEESGFEEPTTFAIGEPNYRPHDAPQFIAALGVTGYSTPGGQRKVLHDQPLVVAGNPTQHPSISAGDTNPRGDTDAPNSAPKTDTDSDQPHDTKPAELPVASVPEPSSIVLLAVGLLGLAVTRRRS